jgi:flavin-dependent dehydrogenase
VYPTDNRGMVFTNDAGKEYRFEQEGLNVWRSHFDGWLAGKAKESGAEVMENFDNPETVREAYRQSTENLKSYMQRQWSLVGGMTGTFREMGR